MTDNDYNLNVIYGLAFGFFVLLIVFIFKIAVYSSGIGSGKRDVILLIGPCGGGKTALFHRLRNGRDLQIDTVTSMKETLETFPLYDEEATKVTVCDFPGHERLRSQATQFYPIAKKIVFVVDSTICMDTLQLRKAAEYAIL
jgi:signal recognition particle receptor subunit beta